MTLDADKPTRLHGDVMYVRMNRLICDYDDDDDYDVWLCDWFSARSWWLYGLCERISLLCELYVFYSDMWQCTRLTVNLSICYRLLLLQLYSELWTPTPWPPNLTDILRKHRSPLSCDMDHLQYSSELYPQIYIFKHDAKLIEYVEVLKLQADICL